MSLQINTLNTSTAAVKPKTPPGREFIISPPLYGRTQWNLDKISRMNISSSGQWTITPTSNFTANVKMWGGSGASYSNSGQTGAGGYSSGTASFKSGTPYILVVGAGGKRVVGSGYADYGNGGYMYYSSVVSPQGGGMSAIFSGSYTQNQAVLIAGGGGSKVGGSGYKSGAGGGSSGQAGDHGGTGGTQTAGGTGDYAGTSLQGAGKTTSSSYNPAGGGGYFGGGCGGGSTGTGGGGSGYVNTSVITNGYTVAGNYSVPGNSTDADRGTSGAGVTSATNGVDGRIIIS